MEDVSFYEEYVCVWMGLDKENRRFPILDRMIEGPFIKTTLTMFD